MRVRVRVNQRRLRLRVENQCPVRTEIFRLRVEVELAYEVKQSLRDDCGEMRLQRIPTRPSKSYVDTGYVRSVEEMA